MHRVLILDTETTGLPKNEPDGTVIQPRIVSISWLLCLADSPSERERSYVVRPNGFTIPREATVIHGISTEYARASGTSLRTVLQQFREDCDALRPQLVVVHNDSFDLPIIEEEFRRVGLVSPITSLRSICTMRTTVSLCRIPRRRGNRFKWPTLQELHIKLFARRFDDAHDSASDVRALSKCFGTLYRSGFYNTEVSLAQITFLAPPQANSAQGYVFSCNDSTVSECLKKNLFGDRTPWPLPVPTGSICFLYNYDSHTIFGFWRAVQTGRQLDSLAWEGSFPYQCRVEPMLAHLTSIARSHFSFLARGHIPNPLPKAHLEKMIRAFSDAI